MASLLSLDAGGVTELVGLTTVGLGLCTMLLRRSIVVVAMGLCVALLGVVLVLAGAAAAHSDARAAAAAIVILLGAAALAPIAAALGIAVFRRRGTVNVDELRELRG